MASKGKEGQMKDFSLEEDDAFEEFEVEEWSEEYAKVCG